MLKKEKIDFLVTKYRFFEKKFFHFFHISPKYGTFFFKFYFYFRFICVGKSFIKFQKNPENFLIFRVLKILKNFLYKRYSEEVKGKPVRNAGEILGKIVKSLMKLCGNFEKNGGTPFKLPLVQKVFSCDYGCLTKENVYYLYQCRR